MSVSEHGAGVRPFGWVAHVPVPLFAATMGVGGLGLAWRAAAAVLGTPDLVATVLLALADLLFLSLAALYLAKALLHPAQVAAEFNHPVRSNFFSAIAIGLMILATGLIPHAPALANGVWLLGALWQLGMATLIIGRWLTREQQITHSNPSWFIPVVGNILAPIAGVPLGHGELSWFMFSVGLVFWLVLFPVLTNRILFHGMLPAKLVPTLFILLAPPSVGFLSWLALTGGVLDPVGRILVGTALFLGAILASRIGVFLKAPFAVSWWAFTFPLAALATATLRYAQLAGGVLLTGLSIALLLLATGVIAYVSWRTVRALVAGHLFVPE